MIELVCHSASSGADVCLHRNGGCAQVCESKLGFAHCSCLPQYILSADGTSCLPADASNGTAGNLKKKKSILLKVHTSL